MKKTVVSGSVRVDLLGGTLDIYPINIVLDNTVTINCATSLKAQVQVENLDDAVIRLISLDYELDRSFELGKLKNFSYTDEEVGPLKFLMLLIRELNPSRGMKITLSSNAPSGSGLGGSSSMGCVFYKAVSEHLNLKISREKIIFLVQRVESKILNQGPAGYQDYYPSLYGGVLALVSTMNGVNPEQLYTRDLDSFLTKHLILVSSNETRDSGINNWEVYKSFFEKDNHVVAGLKKIRDLSFSAYSSLSKGNFINFLDLLSEEGLERERLFTGILTEKMRTFREDLILNISDFKGIKVCGAGGGGCFLVISQQKPKVEEIANKYGMDILTFSICSPVGDS